MTAPSALVAPAPAAPVDYPVCLRLGGRPVLVVGGGVVAGQRAAGLHEAGARVTVVAPEVGEAVAELVARGAVRWERRVFREEDLAGQALVCVATDDRTVSERAAAAARALGVWVNTADVPPLCDFTLPSVGRQGPITVAVSTTGAAPALARRLKNEFMARLGPHHEALARMIERLRRTLPSGPRRMRMLSRLVEGSAGDKLLDGRRLEGLAEVREAVRAARAELAQAGRVEDAT